MNQALKRIEEALNQLETRKNAANPIANSRKPTYSFDLHPPKSNSFTQTRAAFSPKLPDLNVAPNIPTEETSLDSLPEDLELGAKKMGSQLGDKKIRAGFNPTKYGHTAVCPYDTHNKLTDQAQEYGAKKYGQEDGVKKISQASTQQEISLPLTDTPTKPDLFFQPLPPMPSTQQDISLPPPNPPIKADRIFQANLPCPNFSSHTSRQASCPAPGTQVEKSQNKPAPFFQASPPVVEDTDEQAKLDLIVRQIEDLYHSGPIVDGTLEYYPPSPESSDEIREVCFERVIEVEVSNLTSQEIGIPGASYRLSGVDASGKQWSYPCPLDQLLSVSVAIARYQKLQQLLQQKYELEQKRVKDEG